MTDLIVLLFHRTGSPSRDWLIYKILTLTIPYILVPFTLASGEMNYTPIPLTTEQKIEIAFGEQAEIMKQISVCESGMRQFDSEGNTITSPTNDSGLFQINNPTWSNTAKELGLDYLNSEEDNIKMAQHILEVQGLNAWSCYKML